MDMTILLLLAIQATAMQNPVEAYYSATVVGVCSALGAIWIYMQKQFSAIAKRSDASEKMTAEFRVSVEGRFATLAQQISSLPADTALQISESYEKGSKAAREAFVPTAQCSQREKEVDRRLDGIDSVARTAAQHAERANYRIENLENPSHRGD
jgi:hypothetical protein